MKTIKKEVKLDLVSEEVYLDRFPNGDSIRQEMIYSLNKIVDTSKLTHFVEIEFPESLKEFREVNNLSKKDLLNWLNENYK